MRRAAFLLALGIGVVLTPVPQPAWAGTADGLIAFTSYDAEGYSKIYVVKPDGTGLTALTVGGQHDDSHPDWSPDGTSIAYVSGVNGPDEIWVMNADGSGKRSITPGASSYNPAWSPDGSKIAFSGGGDIWVMKADGSSKLRLTNDSDVDDWPTWSPDGQRIVFSKKRTTVFPNGKGGLDVVTEWDLFENVNGGINPLTHTRQHETEPVWRNDGSALLMTTQSETGADLNVSELREGVFTPVLASATHEGDADLAPSGDAIVFVGSGAVQVYDGTLVRPLAVGRNPSWGTHKPTPVTPPITEPPTPALTCAGLPATITGTGGADKLVGTPGNDVIVAGAGKDVVRAGGGKDIVCGGAGNDVLKGQAGKDRLVGGAGKRDSCVGGASRDKATSCERTRA